MATLKAHAELSSWTLLCQTSSNSSSPYPPDAGSHNCHTGWMFFTDGSVTRSPTAGEWRVYNRDGTATEKSDSGTTFYFCHFWGKQQWPKYCQICQNQGLSRRQINIKSKPLLLLIYHCPSKNSLHWQKLVITRRSHQIVMLNFKIHKYAPIWFFCATKI